MKEVRAYKTADGQLFEDEGLARLAEAKSALAALCNDNHSDEFDSSLALDFLLTNKAVILHNLTAIVEESQ